MMERTSRWLSDWLGRSSAFWFVGVLPILIWAACGPLFSYSDTWQLVINTGTTVLTYLFLFLVQRAQNANTLALHLKLDALVLAINEADNRVVRIEEKSEEEIREMR